MNEQFDPLLMAKGDLGDYINDVVDRQIEFILNQDGLARYVSKPIPKQGGNGRGNGGKIPDRLGMIWVGKEEKDALYVEFLQDNKNWAIHYEKTPDMIDKKILQKFRGHDKFIKLVCGSIGTKSPLLRDNDIYKIDMERDLNPGASSKEIEDYITELRCLKLIFLDMINSNILEGQSTEYDVKIIDQYNFELILDGETKHSIDLRDIEPYSINFVGEKICDFFQWWEGANGFTILDSPWNSILYPTDIEFREPCDKVHYFHDISWRRLS